MTCLQKNLKAVLEVKNPNVTFKEIDFSGSEAKKSAETVNSVSENRYHMELKL